MKVTREISVHPDIPILLGCFPPSPSAWIQLTGGLGFKGECEPISMRHTPQTLPMK